MRTLEANLLAAVLAAGASAALAADFDGSKRLICAPVLAMDCAVGEDCVKGTPDAVGAPAFLRIDFDKKAVVGTQRTSPIQAMEKSEAQILLQGSELGYGWTIAIDAASGRMTATLVDRDGAFVLSGSCTPL
jgi:hypothetical protein